MVKAPQKIQLHKQSQTLEVTFPSETFIFTAEFLRVLSPSAEVQGHGPGQEVVQIHKENVRITNVLGQGNYAIKIVFDDGHDSGLFTWEYLYTLGQEHAQRWLDYQRKAQAKIESEITSEIKWVTPESK